MSVSLRVLNLGLGRLPTIVRPIGTTQVRTSTPPRIREGLEYPSLSVHYPETYFSHDPSTCAFPPNNNEDKMTTSFVGTSDDRITVA